MTIGAVEKVLGQAFWKARGEQLKAALRQSGTFDTRSLIYRLHREDFINHN